MKKEVLVLAVVFCFLTFTLFGNLTNAEISGKTITGTTITGNATSANFAVAITVSGSPSLTINKPKNQTYIDTNYLRLDIDTNGNYVWYNLDNGENTTFTEDELDEERAYFNSTSGTHTVYVFANNSYGTAKANVSFTINTFLFSITDSNFNHIGNTTNLSIYSYDEIQNLSNVVFEQESYGKIKFNEPVNLTDDSDPSDGAIDINSYINISSNRIEIDSDYLSNFNKSATLQIYGLTFTNPRILKDGSVCSSDVCTKNSYTPDNGVFDFNVTGFSVYSSEETPANVANSPGGSSGGGSRGGSSSETITALPSENFITNVDDISISMVNGQVRTEKLTITNKKNSKLDFEVLTNSLNDLVVINEPKFSLNSGESKTISLDFLARENIEPNLYVGKIILKGDGKTKNIPVIIEVESPEALLDVKMGINEIYSQVIPGEKIIAEVELFNLGILKRSDITLDYTIEDYEGKEIIKERETVAIETKINLIKEIKIPQDTKSGKYLFYVKATYDGKSASSIANFEVVAYKVTLREKIFILSIIFLVIGLSFVVYHHLRLKQHIKIKKRISARDLIKRN